MTFAGEIKFPDTGAASPIETPTPSPTQLPTPSPTPSPATIQATITALTNTLAALGKQALSEVQPLAEKYGPAIAQWGVEIAAARSVGDQATVDQKLDSIRLVTAEAELMAAELGVNAQAATEQSIEAVLMTAIHFVPLLM